MDINSLPTRPAQLTPHCTLYAHYLHYIHYILALVLPTDPLSTRSARRTCCVVRLPARSLVVWCAYSHAAYDKRKRCRATSLIHSDSPSLPHTPPPALSDSASCLCRPVCRFPPFNGSLNYSPVPFPLRCSTFFFHLLAAYLFYNLSLYMQLTLVESHIFQEETFYCGTFNRCQPVASTFPQPHPSDAPSSTHFLSPARITNAMLTKQFPLQLHRASDQRDIE